MDGPSTSLRLRLRVPAAPADGQADRAVVDLLAETLEIPRGREAT